MYVQNMQNVATCACLEFVTVDCKHAFISHPIDKHSFVYRLLHCSQKKINID